MMLLSIVIVLLINFCTFRCDDPEWDYYLVTQRWSPAACAVWLDINETSSCYDLPRNYWTIHGLWPSSTSGNLPFYCNNVTLDLSKIDSLMPNLKKYWPNLRNYSNDYDNDRIYFWEHEWDKHGTCALSLPQFSSIYKYFAYTLTDYFRYNIFKYLDSSDISPDETKKYTWSKILVTLTGKLGKIPDIACTFKNELHEVRICFDRQSKMIDCPNETNCNKTEPILYF